MIIIRRVVKTTKHWFKVDGTFLSAAVAFYAAMALFPLILVLLSVFGWSLASSDHVQQWREQILELITEQTSERIAYIVSSQLDIIEANARLSGSIGILTLLAFSIALFANLEKAFTKIWQLPNETFGIVSGLRRFLFQRFRAFLMILLLILVVATNFAVNIYQDKMAKYIPEQMSDEYTWWFVQIATEIALNGLLFTGIIQIMTRDKVSWLYAIYGGVLTALLWQPGRYVLATFVISERYSAFELVGSFLAILLWIFYGVITLLYGATVVYIAEQEKKEKRESIQESE